MSVVPNGVEKPFPQGKTIVSKTDLKGSITYGNKLFIEMSGYSEEELIGAPHNIIRHPAMPRLVFKLLWDMLQQKEEINAYVVNLSKDGMHYWVFANVTPSFDVSGNVVGYFSFRRYPDPRVIKSTIEPLYRQLLDAEKQGGMDASAHMLNQILDEKGVDYDEFILSL